jgi:hypothetical protein
MPRLSEKDKIALCSHFTHKADIDDCKNDYDVYSDYQDAKKAGSFKGTLEEYKKENKLSGSTWASTSTDKPKINPPTTKNKTGLFIGLGIAGLIGIGFAVWYFNKNKN